MGRMDVDLGRDADTTPREMRRVEPQGRLTAEDAEFVAVASRLADRYPPFWLQGALRACKPLEKHDHGSDPCPEKKRGKVPQSRWLTARNRPRRELDDFFRRIDDDLNRGHNLAMRVPKGAIVLDADCTASALCLSESLPESAIVALTPKGLHSVHAYEQVVHSRARLLTDEGIAFDIKTSADGCWTVEPSRGSSGAPYLWVQNGEALRELLLRRGEVIDVAIEKSTEVLARGYAAIEEAIEEAIEGIRVDADVAVLPECVEDLMPVPSEFLSAIEGYRVEKAQTETNRANDVMRPQTMPVPSSPDGFWIMRPEDGEKIPEGQRNDRLFRRLRGLRADGAPDEVMREAAFRLAACCEPPYPEDETELVLAQACKVEPGNRLSERELREVGFKREDDGHVSRIVELSPDEKKFWARRKLEAALDETSSETDMARRAQAQVEALARLGRFEKAFSLEQLSMEGLLQRDAAQYEFLVDGLILQRNHVLLAAWGGVGKSYLTVDLAVCAALGLSWCGAAIRQPFSTLFVPYEDDRDEFRRRFEWQVDARLGEGAFVKHREVLGQRIRVVERAALAGHRLDGEMVELIREAVQADPEIRLVVFDPAGKAVGQGGTSEIEAVQEYCAGVAQLCEDAGVTVLTVNHITKASRQAGEDLESTASTGRAELVGDVRAQFQLSAMKKADIETQFPHEPPGTRGVSLKLVKANYAPTWEEPRIFLRGEHGTLLEREVEISKDDAEEAMLVSRIAEAGLWINVEALNELHKEHSVKGGWPARNHIPALLKRAREPLKRSVDGVESVVSPRLQVKPYRSKRRVAVKKQAREVNFYAPNPTPAEWPEGIKDEHFMEEGAVYSNSEHLK